MWPKNAKPGRIVEEHFGPVCSTCIIFRPLDSGMDTECEMNLGTLYIDVNRFGSTCDRWQKSFASQDQCWYRTGRSNSLLDIFSPSCSFFFSVRISGGTFRCPLVPAALINYPAHGQEVLMLHLLLPLTRLCLLSPLCWNTQHAESRLGVWKPFFYSSCGIKI